MNARQPDLRGTCRKAAEQLAETDPSLTVVRGWYVDAYWGRREHWWCVRGNGEIVDPTVEQFPTGHVPGLREYIPYQGIHSCPGCSRDVHEDRNYSGFCCGDCFGATVGLPAGRCEC